MTCLCCLQSLPLTSLPPNGEPWLLWNLLEAHLTWRSDKMGFFCYQMYSCRTVHFRMNLCGSDCDYSRDSLGLGCRSGSQFFLILIQIFLLPIFVFLRIFLCSDRTGWNVTSKTISSGQRHWLSVLKGIVLLCKIGSKNFSFLHSFPQTSSPRAWKLYWHFFFSFLPGWARGHKSRHPEGFPFRDLSWNVTVGHCGWSLCKGLAKS